MKVELTMRKRGGALHPVSARGKQILDSVTTQKDVVVTVHQARNPHHHDKIWALATKVAENDPHFTDADDAMEWAKLQVPWMIRSWRQLETGALIITTKSISFASMDQLKFSEFYERAVQKWSERLGTDVETLEREAAA